VFGDLGQDAVERRNQSAGMSDATVGVIDGSLLGSA
jgi:hypothetical protein